MALWQWATLKYTTLVVFVLSLSIFVHNGLILEMWLNCITLFSEQYIHLQYTVLYILLLFFFNRLHKMASTGTKFHSRERVWVIITFLSIDASMHSCMHIICIGYWGPYSCIREAGRDKEAQNHFKKCSYRKVSILYHKYEYDVFHQTIIHTTVTMETIDLSCLPIWLQNINHQVVCIIYSVHQRLPW